MFTNFIDDFIANQYVPSDIIDKVNLLPRKRLAILAFINENRLLFTEILSIINSNEVCDINHLSILLDKLSSYCPIPLSSRKKYGDTQTNIELACDVLDKLPHNLWDNPTLKWIDPANGIGTFPILILIRLMNGLKEWEPNAQIRCRHIIENMIYVAEIQPIHTFIFQCILNPFGGYQMNIFSGSSIDPEFNKHALDVWGIDKFDVVVGMPPYNYTSYLPFINKFMPWCDHMAFIIPSKITLNLNEVRYIPLLKKNGLTCVKFLGYGKFDVHLSTLYFILNRTNETQSIMINDVVEIEPNDPIHNYENRIEYSIMSKIANLDKLELHRGRNETLRYGSVEATPSIKFEPDYKHRVKMLSRLGGGKKIEFHYINNDKGLTGCKIVMPRASGNFNSMKNHRRLDRDFIYSNFMDSDIAVSRSIMYMYVTNREEYEKLAWYIGRSTWFRYVFIKYNTFEELSKKMFNQYIPAIPLDVNFDDNKLYKYFNFNNAEIRYIENIVNNIG